MMGSEDINWKFLSISVKALQKHRTLYINYFHKEGDPKALVSLWQIIPSSRVFLYKNK